MKRFLPLLILTGLLFGQDTTIVLIDGSTVSGTIISETDSTYRIMGESWRVTDGVYEVFNTFINISKNEIVKQDELTLKTGESYKGSYVKKVDELIVFQVEGENHSTPFPISDVETIQTGEWGVLTYPFKIPRKSLGRGGKFCCSCVMVLAILLYDAWNSIQL